MLISKSLAVRRLLLVMMASIRSVAAFCNEQGGGAKYNCLVLQDGTGKCFGESLQVCSERGLLIKIHISRYLAHV